MDCSRSIGHGLLDSGDDPCQATVVRPTENWLGGLAHARLPTRHVEGRGVNHATADRILTAVKARLLVEGYAALSTRRVADEAGVPLSQIHYHFGGKKGMVLSLLERENEELLARQQAMYAEDAPLWKRYEQACDFLEADLASGYVRVLHEMLGAAWSDDEIAGEVRRMLGRWHATLTEVAEAAEARLGGYGPFTARQVADLVGFAHLGAEAFLLLEADDRAARAEVIDTLRRVGDLIRAVEEGDPDS